MTAPAITRTLLGCSGRVGGYGLIQYARAVAGGGGAGGGAAPVGIGAVDSVLCDGKEARRNQKGIKLTDYYAGPDRIPEYA